MISQEKLTNIYKSYGFEVDQVDEDIAVFSYKRSRYFGVDIIILNNIPSVMQRVEVLKNDYFRSGFATTIKELQSSFEAEEELFKSFFSYDATIVRAQRRYQEFVKKQKNNLLGSEYEYISSPFEIYDSERSGDLLQLAKNLILDNSKTLLIIIEAAAGYGKTSTAYELFNEITKQAQVISSPILTELSRNRGAKIFRYILLDEIDKEYPSLNSDLVIREIQSGRVPLIIDGFDELLEKVNLEADISSLDEIEPMLDTIGNLLENKAKIVLTTRKTAIFNGYEFDQWTSKWENKFEVVRISIKEPSIEDWLGKPRCNILDNHNIPLHHLANPVLLAYLRNLKDELFEIEILNSQNLISQYFNRMLEREKERQNLLISPETQLEIFRNVVKMMLEFDITSEKREFFKEILKDQNSKQLEVARSLYPEKPTIDVLVDSLATHALLDRKGRDGNQIGFINDFILGILIGEIINGDEFDLSKSNYSPYMIELAVTAYRVQSENQRVRLWHQIMEAKNRFTNYTLFVFDVTLLNRPSCKYENLTIKEMSFMSTDFSYATINDSVFINCYFKRCSFDIFKLQGVSFINCVFTQCNSTRPNEQFINNKNLTVIQSHQKDCSIIHDPEYQSLQEPANDISLLEMDVLELLWDHNLDRRQYISQILRELNNVSDRKVSVSLETLEKRGLIIIKGGQVQLQLNKISEIKLLMKK
jgi:hypothetical protein